MSLAMREKKATSPSGNWTPVSRVTGGDTYHYTNEDELFYWEELRNIFLFFSELHF